MTRKKAYSVDFAALTQGKFTFDKQKHILDSKDLIKEIRELSDEKLSKVEELLENQFRDTKDNSQNITEWIDSVNKYWRDEESSSKIKIDRGEVRHSLHDFASQDNGIVVGRPGVGKTYLLKELLDQFKSEDIPHLLLPIDLLSDSNPKEWPDGFSFQDNLIDALKSVPISDKKGIIVFDGFDAARDDRKRKNFLILIQRAIQELDNWNVIVTVRTYDAKKSQDLLDLFGRMDNSVHTPYHVENIQCRHFNIPFLEKHEILLALEQIECPKHVYENGSIEFQEDILSKPFNLWLLEKILQIQGKDPDFSQVYSEIQLLQEYLDRRIKDRDKKHILDGIAREMVKKRTLSLKEFDIYEDLELDKPVRMAAFEKLLSDDILTIDSTTKQNITFSHNILFDYAISVLLIDDEPKQLEKFITEDHSRPLFLRPSLTYFFTRLWYYKNSESFWNAFWHILQSDQSASLRLVARLIPPSVIANEAREIEQLKELIQKSQNKEPIADEAITRLLQALQALQIKRVTPWIDFYDQVSEYLHVDFAWDLANLTSDILKKTTDSNVIVSCGRVGRRLLKWVWQEREKSNDDRYNRLGGNWGVPLVAKTYHTNVEESRTLLVKVLQLTKKDNFPIGFLTRLTDNIDSIFMHDPEFAILIYTTVFSHEFTSEGETQRGGPVFAITTFRSQDFGMCQYRLVKHFSNFLQEKPTHAAAAAIQSLNSFIAKEHVFRFSRKDNTIDELIETFDFNGKTTCFVKDDSYIWDTQMSSDEPIEMADVLFEYIGQLANSEDPHDLLDPLLDVFIENVLVAFFWKRLLETGSQFPKVFAPRLFELCLAKPILLHLEVSYVLGLFLKNTVYEFTPNQLRQIEEKIVRLPSETTNENLFRHLENQRNLFLSQIPPDKLSTCEGKQIREDMDRENNLPDNRPPDTPSFHSETVTEEKWLRDKGVDTTTPENQKLKSFSDSLEEFITEWRNKKPTQEEAALILLKLREVHNNIKGKTNTDDELINILWGKLTESSAILGRLSVDLDEDSFDLCRSILLEGASHNLPDPVKENNENFDFHGYSSQPRHYAATGLIRLSFDKPDTEMLDAIETLAKDKVPSVRMITAMYLINIFAKNPDRFWEIINQRSESETNLVVQEALYTALNFAARQENENMTISVMAKLLNQTPSPEMKTGTSDPFISLLIWLIIERENSWAIDFVNETYLNDPIKYSNMLTRIVMKTIKTYLDPRQLETDNVSEKVKRAISYLNVVISVSVEKIKELCNALSQNGTEENQKNLQDTYRVVDQVITSLYYIFAHERYKSEEQTEHIANEMPCNLYREVKPLMDQVIDFADDPETGVMFAPTAHNFMQLLISFLSCNAKEVIHLAERVAKSSEQYGYNIDAIAVKDIVDFVEYVLADYRNEVRNDDKCLESLLNLLDLFAKTGQSDALKLVWRLDEVFR